MFDIDKIYEKEKIINSYFKEKYDYSSEDIFNKQVLQLLCELNMNLPMKLSALSIGKMRDLAASI